MKFGILSWNLPTPFGKDPDAILQESRANKIKDIDNLLPSAIERWFRSGCDEAGP